MATMFRVLRTCFSFWPNTSLNHSLESLRNTLKDSIVVAASVASRSSGTARTALWYLYQYSDVGEYRGET
jgi:hypothetical protein